MKQYYIGLDLGTKWTYATMIDGKKNVIRDAKIPCTEEAVERFFMGAPKECLNVVMEACGIWHGLYDYLVTRCKVVKVANPTQTRLDLAGRKTDKWDSRKLAEKLRADEIYEAYVPSKEARDYRCKVRHRQRMIGISTELKNMVYAVLRRENIKRPFDDVFTKKGIAWLRTFGISEIDSCLELINATAIQVNMAEESVPRKYEREIRLLKTMPGVGNVTAPVIMAEIADIKRFGTPKALCKYAGLVPRVIQSGESDRRGRLVKQSSAILRTAMVQSAHGVIHTGYDNKLKAFFQRLARRKEYNTAVTALANKMLYIIWIMLTNNEEFHEGGTPVGD